MMSWDRNVYACGFGFWLLALAGHGAGSPLLPVWNMDEGLLTEPGGYYNHFQAGESEVRVHLTPEVRRGSGGRSMQMVYRKGAAGYCGVWFHLFDEEVEGSRREFLDVSSHPYLSLWVRGGRGGEDFTVQMADPRWLAKDDSSPAGRVSRYLGHRLTTDWEEVVIPWSDFGLRGSRAATLTLNFTVPGQGTVYVDDIYFKAAPEVPVPVTPKTAAHETSGRDDLVWALWVWESIPLLLNAAERETFFDFCNDRNIDEVFFQIVSAFETAEDGRVSCRLAHKAAQRSFNRQARERGILVHALDGRPEYVLASWHPKVLAQVRAIVEFNRQADPAERFYGIHYDNEPYLLPAFESPAQADILRQYLELNKAIGVYLREQGSGMVFGVDIPFWFDERKDQALDCFVTFEGAHRDAAEHVIRLVDNVGIMDYRNFAGGADGMIIHGRTELEYARAAGTRVYLGVETYRDQPTPVYFLDGIPEEQWPALVEENRDVMWSTRFQGFRLATYAAGAYRHLGLSRPASAVERGAFEEALAALWKIRQRFVGNQGGQKSDAAADAVRKAIVRAPNYHGYERFMITTEDGAIRAAGFVTRAQMPEKITFAGKTRSVLEEVLDEVAFAFRDEPSFIGFAIHYYKTYRALPE